MSLDYKSLLNDEQYDACTTVDGPLLILAGAGSGKTRAITHRIAYMIGELKIEPWSILAITFTNKAAKEMKDRVRELVGDIAENMWISTFHSTCVKILRRDIDKIGYKKDFTIYDSYDQKALIKQCMNELNINDKENNEKAFLKVISNQKNMLITPGRYRQLSGNNFANHKYADVYELYQRKLTNNNALDFDDLIMKTVEVFKASKDVLDFYRRKFKYIMVDEYQDTNHAQYMLINLLASEHRNICVVGDDDQSIYQFRGADLRNILEFENDYSDAKVIKLEENYRSKGTILKAANAVIKNNLSRKEKTMRTSNPMGEKIKYYTAFSDKDEGSFVSKEVAKLARDGRNYNEFAVLYRTNAQSRIFEESFMRNSIPYKIVGGIKFYDRKEIKDIMAYLRLINNPFDEISLRRIINVPKRAIGDTTVNKILEVARDNNLNMFDVLMDIEEFSILSGKTLKNVIAFRDLISELMDYSAEASVSDLLEELLNKTQYLEEYSKSRDPEELSRVENIEELLNATAAYDEVHEDSNLSDYLEEVSLISDVDKYDENADAVVLMTVHSSKGLEFPVVFLVGMENGIFPSAMAMEDINEMEETRRLAYVAITRAKDLLYITNAEARYVFGRTMMYPPSSFIEDIPSELIENLNEDKNDFGSIKSKQDRATMDSMYSRREKINPFNPHSLKSSMPSIRKEAQTKGINEGEIKLGSRVNHPKFGDGVVVSVTKEKNDVKVTVAFDRSGVKTLLLGLAPLSLL